MGSRAFEKRSAGAHGVGMETWRMLRRPASKLRSAESRSAVDSWRTESNYGTFLFERWFPRQEKILWSRTRLSDGNLSLSRTSSRNENIGWLNLNFSYHEQGGLATGLLACGRILPEDGIKIRYLYLCYLAPIVPNTFLVIGWKSVTPWIGGPNNC